MITKVEFLKYSGQVYNSIYLEVKRVNFDLMTSSDMRCLIWAHDKWSGLGAEELVHRFRASVSSWVEKGGQEYSVWFRANLAVSRFTEYWDTELCISSSTFYKLSSSLHGWPLWRIDWEGGRLYFLTYNMRSYGLHFSLEILRVLLSKKVHLAFFVVHLNADQFCLVLHALKVHRALEH